MWNVGSLDEFLELSKDESDLLDNLFKFQENTTTASKFLRILEDRMDCGIKEAKGILVVDIEGTIVSVAEENYIVRPGTHSFLYHAKSIFEHVVFFSAVEYKKSKDFISLLCDTKELPEECRNMDIVKWTVNSNKDDSGFITTDLYKDLSYVKSMFDGHEIGDIVILDDDKFWIHPEQKDCHIPIISFGHQNYEDSILVFLSKMFEKYLFSFSKKV